LIGLSFLLRQGQVFAIGPWLSGGNKNKIGGARGGASQEVDEARAVGQQAARDQSIVCQRDMFRGHEDMHHLVSAYGVLPEGEAYIRAHPFRPERGTTSGRVALERRIIHIEDVLGDPEYTYNEGQSAAGYGLA
jgi:hypothetical protein